MTPHLKMQLINGAIMSGFMSFVLAGFFTWMNLGFTQIWLPAWVTGFLIGWPVAFVLSALVGKRVNQLAQRLAGM